MYELIEKYQNIIPIIGAIVFIIEILIPILIVFLLTNCGDKLKIIQEDNKKTNQLLEEIRDILINTNKSNLNTQRAIHEKLEEINKKRTL